MFPLRDDNPTTTAPIVTVSLIVLNVVIYMYQASLGPRAGEVFIYQFGAIPSVIFGNRSLPPDVEAIPPYISLFTSMFLHGGLMHLLGNMLFLWIFGNNIEEAMGRFRFILFYLITGFAASLAHAFTNLESAVPAVGASGAISGVLGAYVLLYPRAQVLTLVVLVFFIRLMYIPAGFVLGIWFVMQLLSGSMSNPGNAGGVAFWAHVGGFVAGMALVGLFKRREVRFFNPPVYHPRFLQNW